MNDQSSNSSVPGTFPENVYKTFTTELSHKAKFTENVKNSDGTVNDSLYKASNATAAEDDYDTSAECDTVTEDDTTTTREENEEELQKNKKDGKEPEDATTTEIVTLLDEESMPKTDNDTTYNSVTITEEDEDTTIEEDDGDEEQEADTDVAAEIITEVITEATTEVISSTEGGSEENDNIHKQRATINEENLVNLRYHIVASPNDLIIKGDDILETGHSVEDKSTLALIPKSSPSLKKIKEKLICVVGPDNALGLVQEPWPKDVKLYQPYEVEQILLPDNANCLAVQAFLRMCDLDFEVVSRANAEFMSPSGKVPFIKCGAFIVSELEGIVQFVNNKGISLTTNMEPEQKSDMRAYMSLVHNVLENAELYLCWCDKETYNEVTKPRNGSVYPWPLNYFQTWSKKSAVSKRLKMMGWYSKSLEDVYQEVENCCQALTDRLEGKEYFFGKKFTEMDAIVYGHIYSILTISLPADNNRLAYLIQQYEKLTDHCRRIHKQVMKQDQIFVVTEYSRIVDSGNDTENDINLVSETSDILEGDDYEDIDDSESLTE